MNLFLLLFRAFVIGTQVTENDLEAKRREMLGIHTTVVTKPKWTPNGTIFVQETQENVHHKNFCFKTYIT